MGHIWAQWTIETDINPSGLVFLCRPSSVIRRYALRSARAQEGLSSNPEINHGYPTLKRALAELKRDRLALCLGKGRDAEWERIGSWNH